MTQIHNDEDGLPELSNRTMLKIIMQRMAGLSKEFQEDLNKKIMMVMQEIVDVRRELKIDIEEISTSNHGLNIKIDDVAGDVRALRYDVRKNNAIFMKNHDNLEERVDVLELAK